MPGGFLGLTAATGFSFGRRLAEMSRPAFFRRSRTALTSHGFGWRHSLLLEGSLARAIAAFRKSLIARLRFKNRINFFDHVLEGLK